MRLINQRFSIIHAVAIVLALSWLPVASIARAAEAAHPATSGSKLGAAKAPAQPEASGAKGAAVATDTAPNRTELQNFDRFLDAHPGINKDVRANPKLLDDQKWVKARPELDKFLSDHPGVRQQVRENPRSFVKAERGYQNKEAQLASLDRFLDAHPDINKDVRKDPKLMENGAYLKEHPPLKGFLDGHPGIDKQVMADPQAFMRGERRYQSKETERHG